MAAGPPPWTRSDPIAQQLLEAARDASGRAHAPHSGFAVGAAGLARGGAAVTGFNVESPSWALTVHAEVAMLVVGRDRGELDFTHLLCCLGSGTLVPPCGLCRQLLCEQVGPGLLVATDAGWQPLGEMLPWAFTSSSLGLA
jgi:cytidine deaminase